MIPHLTKHYTMPLADWISIALNRERLEAAAAAIRKGAPLDQQLLGATEGNRRYLLKILDEEVTRQFKDQYQPLVQIISNSIDARPTDVNEKYAVETRLRFGGHFTTSDEGRSMSLEEILTLLIIPFNSNKDPGKDIGRFGVGFLSTLNYCLQNPGESEVRVAAHTGSESYMAVFSSGSSEVAGLNLSITPHKARRNRHGTTVEISSCIRHRNVAERYIAGHFAEFSPRRAIIRVNKRQINKEFKGTAYYQPQRFILRGTEVSQSVGVVIHHTRDFDGRIYSYGQMLLTSQGVKIITKEISSANIKVDLPPAVLLVEGRDEFKQDANYRAAIETVFGILAGHITRQRSDTNTLAALRDMVPSIATALGITKPEYIPHFNDVFAALFSGQKYIAPAGYYNRLRQFFGPEAASAIYPASLLGHAFWQLKFEHIGTFIREHAQEKHTTNFRSLSNSSYTRSIYYNSEPAQTNPVLAGLISTKTFEFALKHVPDKLQGISGGVECLLVDAGTSGASPFMALPGKLYINLAHPCFKSDGLINRYTACQRLAEAITDNEEKAEQQLWGRR